MTERADNKALQAENVRLVALLESHGIVWRGTPTAAAQQLSLTARTPDPLLVPPATCDPLRGRGPGSLQHRPRG